MINIIKDIFKKYKEVILYLVFGGLTTLVNIIVYYSCAQIAGYRTVPSNIIAWLIAVVFAYVTNKIFVFNSKTRSIKDLSKEISSFFGCRLLSGMLDTGIMWLMVDVFGFNDIAIKIISNIIVVILNYLFSKLFIFKNNKKS